MVSDQFASTGWMADIHQVLMLPDDCPDRPSGAEGTCYTVEYVYDAAQSWEGWAGVMWQYPPNNWGSAPGLCIADGATNINFCARGEVGGEVVSFGGGGDATSGANDVLLTTEWTPYTVVIGSVDYNAATDGGGVASGFLWVAAGVAPIRFYIDDIKWETTGPRSSCAVLGDP